MINEKQFFQIPSHVMHDTRLNSRQKLLFSILNEFLQHDEGIEYENKHLAEKNQCAIKSVQSDLAALKKYHYIETYGGSFQRRFFKGECYYLTINTEITHLKKMPSLFIVNGEMHHA